MTLKFVIGCPENIPTNIFTSLIKNGVTEKLESKENLDDHIAVYEAPDHPFEPLLHLPSHHQQTVPAAAMVAVIVGVAVTTKKLLFLYPSNPSHVDLEKAKKCDSTSLLCQAKTSLDQPPSCDRGSNHIATIWLKSFLKPSSPLTLHWPPKSSASLW